MRLENYLKDFLLVIPFVILTYFFHSEIFDSANHPFIILVLFLIILFDKQIKFSYRQIYNTPVFIFILFICYTYLRFDYNYFQGFKDDGTEIESQNKHLTNMLIYLIIFILSIISSSSVRRIPRFFSLYFFIYVCMFITAVLIAADDNFSLGAGVTLLVFFPFILLGFDEKDELKSTKINIITIFIFLFLFLIGNRAASLALLIFIILYNIWPFVLRNKFFYYQAR